ncbi:MAG: hypothetical protein ACE5IL_10305 [Myxococcota bacterium]
MVQRLPVAVLRPLALLGALGLGCSGSEAPAPQVAPTPAAPRAAAPRNHAPQIVGLRLTPESPTTSDLMRAEIDVRDRDGDPLDIRLDWFRNGVPIRGARARTLSLANLRRGDEIFVRATVSDTSDTVTRTSDSRRVADSPPRVTSLHLEPSAPSGADSILAVVDGNDPDGDSVEFQFAWWRNGKRIEGATGPTLAEEEVARGDLVRVEVIPSDGSVAGEPMRSADVRIQNAPPRITSEPSYEVAGPHSYQYQIEAEDPDGDSPLRYSLVEGPAGMEVDLIDGLLRWEVPGNARGNYPIEIAVQDPHGGETHQRYSIDLDWETPASGS